MSSRTRAAAQTLNHIWITDDALAEAFNRFALVSHATRRYGSHVPGPMESRRRSSKRRMALASIAAANPPPGFDFAALLGLGRTGPAPSDPEKSWKWEAPLNYSGVPSISPPMSDHWPGLLSRPSNIERATPQSKDSNEWAGTGLSRSGAAAAFPYQLSPTSVSIPALTKATKAQDTPQKKAATAVPDNCPVELSTEAFHDMLVSVKNLKTVDQKTMDSFVAFLQSSADEPDSCNCFRLVTWLQDRTVEPAAIKAFDRMLYDKIQLQSICNDELAQILAIWCQESTPEMESRLGHVLRAFGDLDERTRDLVQLTTETLLDSTSVATEQAEFSKEAMITWLNTVRGSSAFASDDHDSQDWQQIYYKVLERYTTSELSDYLMQLKWEAIAKIFLRHRAPHIGPKPSETPNNSAQEASATDLDNGNACGVETLMTDYAELTNTLEPDPIKRGLDSMVDVLVVLHQNSIPHSAICEELFDLVSKSKSARYVNDFWKRLRRRNQLQATDEVLDIVMHALLDAGTYHEVSRARIIFSQHRHLPLSRYPELPLKMIECGLGSPRDIFDVLLRRTRAEKALTGPVAPGKPHLPQVHVDIAHLVALKYAECKSIPDRVAFRRVWECCRFLQDRHAPLTTVMSRAMVKAGVTRLLQSRKRVPVSQMNYILKYVADIEGPDRARKIDQISYAITRKQMRNGHMLSSYKTQAKEHTAGLARTFRVTNWAKGRRTLMWRSVLDGTKLRLDPFSYEDQDNKSDKA